MTLYDNGESLQEQVQGDKTVIVQFGSESCYPCKAIKNKIKIWNKEHTEIQYIYISVDDNAEMCAQMGIFSVPTIFVYVAGKLTLRESGCFSLSDILNKTEQYNSMLCE